MNFLFVNFAPPDLKHVSALRAYKFAEGLAFRGHNILYLTRQSASCDEITKPFDRLRAHPNLNVVRVRDENIKAKKPKNKILPRKVRTFQSIFIGGGTYTSWVTTCIKKSGEILDGFVPDIAWTTFGNASNAILTSRLASKGNYPWVLDIKDNWCEFVPFGLRRVLARRLGSCSALTCNSQLSKNALGRCFAKKKKIVVYSGVGEEYLIGEHLTERTVQECKKMMLIGSTYSKSRLRSLLLAAHQAKLEGIVTGLDYAGSDSETVKDVVSGLGLEDSVNVLGQISTEMLAAAARRSVVNCYIWEKTTFHHKLLELLAIGRPVVAFPGEHEESRSLAKGQETVFMTPSNAEDLLACVRIASKEKTSSALDCRYTWDNQVAKLLEVLLEAVNRKCAE